MNKDSQRSKGKNATQPKTARDNIIQKEVNDVKEKFDDLSEKVKKNQYEKKEFMPDVYNDLQPYTEISNIILKKTETEENGFLLRNTAIDLCDPWVSLKYDTQIMTDKISLVSPRENQENKKTKKKEDSEVAAEGSTLFPEYYMSTLEDPELAKKQLFFIDVPMLRKTLHDRFSNNAHEKIDFDYKRTKQDFHRMQLGNFDNVKPFNRENMRAAYFAYLQNNPGSKKALKECVKEMDEKTKK